MTSNPNLHKLTEEEHKTIFEQKIKPALFKDVKLSDSPVAVIFGGQPGAGKTAAISNAQRELASQGGAVLIAGDDLRDYHPKYAQLMKTDDKTAAFYTDRDTGQWVEMAIAEAKAQRANIVIEGTMRDNNKVSATMESLREAGYQIDARALAVNPRLSEQGILLRYEGQKADRGIGRMTTPEAHKAGYDGMLQTLDRIERDKLADRVTVYRREGRQVEVIYSNKLENGQWAKEPRARSVVETERNRPMSLQERRDYAQGFDKLAELLSKRQASPEEVQKIDGLRQQARAMLAAEVFRQEPPEKAVQKHPELAGAAAVLTAIDKKAEADGMNEQQRAVVMARARQNVANSIERGELPEVKIREERQTKIEPTQRDPER